MEFLIIVVVLSLLFFFNAIYKKNKFIKNLNKIFSYKFNSTIVHRFRKEHPELSLSDVENVFLNLKDYFAACFFYLNYQGYKKPKQDKHGLGMPSKVVDDAWHTFILFSKEYEIFCKETFGKILHHNPDDDTKNNNSTTQTPKFFKSSVVNLHNTFGFMKENGFVSFNQIHPIFLMDSILKVKDGFYYNTNDAVLMNEQFYKKSVNNGGGSSCSSCGSSNTCYETQCDTSSDSSSSSDGGGSSCSSCGGGGD